MGFINWLAEARRSVTEKAVDLAVLDPSSRANLSTANLPVYPVWFWAPARGIPRQTNIPELRQFSRSAWVQMVKNAIKKAVLDTKWDIVLQKDEDEEQYEEQSKYVKYFFENPNRDPQKGYDDIINVLLDDILDVDAGALFLNGSKNSNLTEMIPFDGSSFLKELDTAGFIKMYWQYSFRHPVNSPKKFAPEEIGYLQMNVQSHQPYGFSPLQSIQQVVQLLDHATKYNKDFFSNNAIPSVLIRISGQKDSARKVKNDWLSQIEGENSKILVLNSPEAQIEKLALTNRDMEWLDGQKWYMHLVFAAYGLSPSEVGITDTTAGKSVQEGQERISIRNAHKPYLRLFERFFNKTVIPRILGEATLPLNSRTPLKFKYFIEDPEMEKAENEAQRLDVQAKILSINEVRKERGLEPFSDEQADNPFMMPDLGGGLFGQDDKVVPGKRDEEEDKRGRGRVGADEKAKAWTTLEKTPLPEPEGFYDDFFTKVLKRWRDEIINAIEKKLYKIPRTADSENVFLKGFSDFLQGLLGGASLLPFLGALTATVKQTMMRGVDEAEKELDVNVTLGADFTRKVDAYTKQQFDGYTLQDGKKWVGLRGVAKKLQQEVYDRVRKGFENREQTSAIIKDVDELLGGLERSRAATIVRTESNRLVNEGKLSAYKASGVDGFKEYVAFLDESTSAVCQSLNGQIRKLDEPFDAPNGFKYSAPPAHPNCRSFVRFTRNKR